MVASPAHQIMANVDGILSGGEMPPRSSRVTRNDSAPPGLCAGPSAQGRRTLVPASSRVIRSRVWDCCPALKGSGSDAGDLARGRLRACPLPNALSFPGALPRGVWLSAPVRSLFLVVIVHTPWQRLAVRDARPPSGQRRALVFPDTLPFQLVSARACHVVSAY